MSHTLRIFPTLTILNNDLVKTIDYKNPRYLGDPVNAIKLFNNKNVDEISILDISNRFGAKENYVNFPLLKEMAQEAFVPLSYGGNIKNSKTAEAIINIGFEKVILNSIFFDDSYESISIINKIGSQSVVFKIDYIIKQNHFVVFFNEGKNSINFTHKELLKVIQESGAGEVILSRIDYDGKMNCYDYENLSFLVNSLSIPVVLCHGAKDKNSILDAYKKGFSNFTASSIYVYYGNLNAVLINDPFYKK